MIIENTIRCISLACLFLLSSTASSTVYAQISKCQDADGKWHYGDNAAAACGDAKITVYDRKGLKINEIDTPPTAEEVEARKAAKQRAEEEKELQRQRQEARKRILRVYPDEASIIRARDQRVNGIDKQIKLDETLLDDLRLTMNKLEAKKIPEDEKKAIARLEKRKSDVQEQIDEYSRVISKLRREREATKSKYQSILEEFWDLTGDPRAKKLPVN